MAETYTRAPGDRLTFGLLRGTASLEADVVVGERVRGLDRLVDDVDPEKSLVTRLGVIGLTVDEDISGSMGDLRLPYGVVVVGRSQRARAADIPLSAGDVIHAVNGIAISSVKDLDDLLNGLEAQSAVALQIERDGKLRFVAFVVE